MISTTLPFPVKENPEAVQNDNTALLTDSYKMTQRLQYPVEGLTNIHSYLSARVGATFPETVFFGPQYLIPRYLKKLTSHDVEEAHDLFAMHYGSPDLFYKEGFDFIINELDGNWPIKISAIPEGMVTPINNVLMTVENTHDCFWATSILETLMVENWYPTTVATQGRAIRRIILDALERTGDPKLIDFKLHDFGFRGVSSPESAAWGGAAHLINFYGTDTVPALTLLRDYYSEPCAGYSIPASEHSTMTTWGEDGEIEAFRNMIRTFGHFPLYACVSDSWDIMRACDIWGIDLKEEVLAATGTLVVRPDSGDPAQVVLDVCKRLMHHFGYHTNDKGFDVLNDKVRVIQGDGVNIDSIALVLRTLEHNNISADNVAFGMGGSLLQRLDRDTQNFAFKCSSKTVNGEEFDVFKRPATDPMKDSKRGKFAVVDGPHGHVITIALNEYLNGSTDWGTNYLQPLYEDGRLLRTTTFAEVRERARA